MSDQLRAWLDRMPGRRTLPFELERATLYTVPELYLGIDLESPQPFAATLDERIWRWTRAGPDFAAERPLSVAEKLAARLHDTGIDTLVAAFLAPQSQIAVGFMGGHDVERTDPAFETVARMARTLRRRPFMIVTGGGPGLMEAANLGAFMAAFDDDALDAALEVLRSAPRYSDRASWVATAMEVRRVLLGRWDADAPAGSANLGIPTWYYGSEPPNLFATCIGKYFFNSLREDGLVSVANGGLIFAKGEAGTVQEVFQNTALNYYLAGDHEPTPLAFLDAAFWNPGAEPGGAPPDPLAKPVYPLVAALAAQARIQYRGFADYVLASSDPDAILAFMVDHNADRLRPRLADACLARACGEPPPR